ncbi:DUF1622 domain-containing protein [Novilysobacter selenitireducens]|uniref:DUF1622 domain-containing protein n=1 Tax=Novilysobacter selenitireducens TaxID=2872639 RepID=A0ABS7T5I9_9GAMM|nr:DUF1622 domain-containing protein [Lysobacter selenitireducens]MBZ4039120.1 DUF1622 domain-containing protein [Lysobacter selenitireducens]
MQTTQLQAAQEASGEDGIIRLVEWSALSIELLAIALIAVTIAVATTTYVASILMQRGDRAESYERFRRRLGRALLIGLEILVAADIIRTVALESTLQAIASLGLLVLIRTFLSWSVVLEIEGRWPWQSEPRATTPPPSLRETDHG